MPEVGAKSGISSDPPLAEGQIVTGAIFNEPMRVEAFRGNGPGMWEIGLSGVQTERFRRVNLTLDDISKLQIARPMFSYEGDGQMLRVGIRHTPSALPTSSTRTSASRSRVLILCHTNPKPFTTIS